MNRRIHLKEFILRKPEISDPVVQAGFVRYLEGIRWMTLDQWEEELVKYNNRKI